MNSVYGRLAARLAAKRGASAALTRFVRKRPAYNVPRPLGINVNPFRSKAGLNPAYLRGSSVEVKSFDLDFAAQNMVNIGAVAGAATLATGMSVINMPTLGSTFYQRIGAKITLKSVRLTFTISAGVSPNVSYSDLRYMLVYDRQTNGAYPAIGDILASNDGAPTLYSGINIANRDRFVILRDARAVIDPAVQDTVQVDQFVKTPGLQVQFKSSSGPPGVIGDISTGAIYFILFFNTAVGAGVPVVISANTRVRYLD